MYKFYSESTESTEDFAKKLAKSIDKPVFIALFGGLGMGKTAFTRGFCEGMGYTGEVSSPTFSLIHEYRGGRLDVYHFDMYRVTSFDSLYSTGFFDYLEQGVIITEWSENILPYLPDSFVKITISRGKDENSRVISIEGEQIENTCG